MMGKVIRMKPRHFIINSKFDVSNATKLTLIYARNRGFNLSFQSSVATVVSELGTNMVKYSDRGYITVGIVKQKKIGIEIIAEDVGPGMIDIESAMIDHISSGNTLGVGLPGVRRMVDLFEIDSDRNMGTKVVVLKWGLISC